MAHHQFTLPRTSADITTDWINDVLEQSESWKHGVVSDLSIRPIGGIDSLASAVFRVALVLQSSVGMPLLVKMQVKDLRPQLIAMYEAESYFYNHYASRAGVPVAPTYFSAFDPVEERFVVVQDFLTDGEVGTTGTFLSEVDLIRAVLNLADLHTRWWASAELAADRKVRRMRDMVSRSNGVLQDPDLNPIPAFLGRFESLLSAESKHYFETMPIWRPILATKPWGTETLIHADCSSKNMMFPFDTAQAPVLFDWAFFHSGPAAYDLAVLISSSASAEGQLRTASLLEVYLDRLRSNGIVNYDHARLAGDYARSLMFRSYGLPLVVSWDTEESRGAVDTTFPSMVAALETAGAFKLAVDLCK